MKQELKKTVPTVYRDEHVVQSYAIDLCGRVFAHHLFTTMLNAAWNHVQDTPFDYQALAGQGRFWALAKFYMEIFQFPDWGDRITVETWGRAVDRFLAMRDFAIVSETSRPLAEATSAWLILDRETLRPQRAEPLHGTFVFLPERSTIDTTQGKIAPLENPQPALSLSIRYSDIDVNQHVTAARYLQWLLDSYTADFIRSRTLRSVELNFLAEAKEQDLVTVSTENRLQPSCEYLHSVTRSNDGKELLRGRLVWSETG